MSYKADFPLLRDQPEIIYLDSAATAQKSAYVIDWVKTYLERDYANIHRWLYGLAQRSEDMFWHTKKKVAERIWGQQKEIIFTANSTAASNLIVSSLSASGRLEAGDKVMLSAAEHHANVVPRQMAAQQLWCEIIRIGLDDERDISLQEMQEKRDDRVKVIALSYVSNVTGAIHRVEEIGRWLNEKYKDENEKYKDNDKERKGQKPLYIIDASQAAPHLQIDVGELGCDMLYLTGHKLGALPGIGVLRGKAELLRSLQPWIGWGGAVSGVSCEWYTLQDIPDKFEPGTPNLVWVISLLKSLEYLQTYAWTEKKSRKEVYGEIDILEKSLMELCLQEFELLEQEWHLRLIWPKDIEKRVGVFSFTLLSDKNPFQLGQYLADKGVCMRVGGQCAQPLHQMMNIWLSCRISLRIYNDMQDIQKFFEEMKRFLYHNNAPTDTQE